MNELEERIENANRELKLQEALRRVEILGVKAVPSAIKTFIKTRKSKVGAEELIESKPVTSGSEEVSYEAYMQRALAGLKLSPAVKMGADVKMMPNGLRRVESTVDIYGPMGLLTKKSAGYFRNSEYATDDSFEGIMKINGEYRYMSITHQENESYNNYSICEYDKDMGATEVRFINARIASDEDRAEAEDLFAQAASYYVDYSAEVSSDPRCRISQGLTNGNIVDEDVM